MSALSLVAGAMVLVGLVLMVAASEARQRRAVTRRQSVRHLIPWAGRGRGRCFCGWAADELDLVWPDDRRPA